MWEVAQLVELLTVDQMVASPNLVFPPRYGKLTCPWQVNGSADTKSRWMGDDTFPEQVVVSNNTACIAMYTKV